jgi:hypothetical protein
MRVEVGDGAQQQRLATARSALDADALAGADREFDRTDMASDELLNAQAGHTWSKI